MIVGNGLIAKALLKRTVFSNSNTVYFASGVSNSLETRETEFQRERLLLKNVLMSADRVVYFSTTPKNSSPYMEHKREMESIVRRCPNHLIFRVQYVVGNGGNKTNLVNYLKTAIENGNEVKLYMNVYRAIIDVEDLVKIVYELGDHIGTVTLNGIDPVPVTDIAAIIASILNKPLNYELIKSEPEAIASNDAIIDTIIERLKIDRIGYTQDVLKKYL